MSQVEELGMAGVIRWDVLVIEGDEETRGALRQLIPAGLRVHWMSTAAEAEPFLRAHEVRLVICADDLPDLPGLMLLAQTRDLWPATQRILMCRDLDADFLAFAIKEGSIFNYLPKPLDADVTRHLIEHSLRQSRLLESLSTTQSLLDAAEARRAREQAAPAGGLLSGAALRLLFWIGLSAIFVFAVLLLGFTALYLLKSTLGVDIFPELHLQDLISP